MQDLVDLWEKLQPVPILSFRHLHPDNQKNPVNSTLTYTPDVNTLHCPSTRALVRAIWIPPVSLALPSYFPNAFPLNFWPPLDVFLANKQKWTLVHESYYGLKLLHESPFPQNKSQSLCYHINPDYHPLLSHLTSLAMSLPITDSLLSLASVTEASSLILEYSSAALEMRPLCFLGPLLKWCSFYVANSLTANVAKMLSPGDVHESPPTTPLHLLLPALCLKPLLSLVPNTCHLPKTDN